MNTAARGRVLYAGRVVVQLRMEVDQRPPTGAESFADSFSMEIGGGFHALNTARAMGVTAEYIGATGTGPLGDIVRQELHHAGILTTGPRDTDVDTGYVVEVNDSDGRRTLLNTRGAELALPYDAFADIHAGTNDVVFLSGYLLHEARSAEAALNLVARLKGQGHVGGRPVRRDPTFVIDPSTILDQLPEEALQAVAGIHPLWTMGMSEAYIGAGRLGLPGHIDRHAAVAAALSDRLQACLVIRDDGGCWVADGSEPRFIPSADIAVKDATDVVQVHVGALCAELARGATLDQATAWANAAASHAAAHGTKSRGLDREAARDMLVA